MVEIILRNNKLFIMYYSPLEKGDTEGCKNDIQILTSGKKHVMKIHSNPKLKEKARELHNNSTLSEVLLWNKLKR